MQWTRDGGFTSGAPWLPYGDLSRNVEDERRDPASLLSLYRRLLWFRRGSDALRFGAYTPVEGVPESVYAYVRTSGEERLLVVLNFSNDGVSFELPSSLRATECVVGTHGEGAVEGTVSLSGNEGRVLRLG
jgi:alpha-glucosidase